ncbi:MAG: dolichol kinase [Planctomycetota bacterium]|jgi:dolichol kinase
MEILVYVGIFAMLYIVIRFTRELFGMGANATRRILHTAGGIVIWSMPFFISATEIAILMVVFAATFLVTKKTGFMKSVHHVPRKTWGELWYPLTIAVMAFVALPDAIQAFQYGVLVLAIADPMASLIGLNIPSTKIKVWGGTKTVLGTLTFFLVACGIGILMMQGAPLGIWAPLIAAVVLAFLEFALSYGLDNIAIMVGGVLLYTVFL